VLLTVSKGLAPALVPNVVGLAQTQANTRLLAAGFSTGIVTRQFDANVPRGEILAQSPAAGGEQVPGPVNITVSAGNGLALRLDTAVTTANLAIPFVAVNQDLSGVESPATGLTTTIEALQPPVGPNPTISGNTIVPALATRGAFRLTIVDGQGRQASAEFGVSEPVVAGEAEPTFAAYRRLSQALQDIDDLLVQGRAALEANDVPLQRSIVTQVVQRWRQVNLGELSFAVAMSPELGFVPLVSDMVGFGVSSTPDDLLANDVLKESNLDLRAWTEALRTPGTSLNELRQLADKFGSGAARLSRLQVTEWGHVNNATQYTMLLSTRIPELYEALIDELAIVVGLPPSRTAALQPGNGGTQAIEGNIARSLFASQLTNVASIEGADRPQLNSTLSEELVTIALEYTVDKIVEQATDKYRNGKQYATDILGQAAKGTGILTATAHLRRFIQGQDLGQVVAGASLSFHTFRTPYSFIEGPWDIEDPEMNKVFIVGPNVIDAVISIVQKIQDSQKWRKQLNPLADDGKYKSQKEISKDLQDFRTAVNELKAAEQTLAKEIGAIEQKPSGIDAPCIFDPSPTCSQLMYVAGLASAYTYSPPAGFEAFTGLPLPIAFIVYNQRTGVMYFSTPTFFPTPKENND
jgi:hypothetical protein